MSCFDAQNTERTGSEIRARSGIAGLMVVALQSKTELERAHAVRCRLLNTLCGRWTNVAMVGLAFTICGLAALVRDGVGLAASIALAGAMIIAVRCAIIIDVQARYKADLIPSPERALLPFALSAVASSVCWGVLCFVVMTMSHDDVLAVIVMMCCVGTAGSVAARNAGVPRLAKIMLVVSLAPIVVASFFAADAGFMLLALLVPAMAGGLFVMIDASNEQLVELFEMQITQSRLSNTDPLTQVSNRRHFDDSIAAAVTSAARFAWPLAVLMIDVDHFKAFNDLHGHPAGDVCLRAIADILRRNLRNGDQVFRYGGEEFAIILPKANGTDAEEIASRICAAVADSLLHPLHFVTISVGIATTDEVAVDATALIAAADMALYRAKNEGRNRIVRFGGGEARFGRAAA